MLNRCRVTIVEVFFLVLVYVFKLYLFEFFATILEKGLFHAGEEGQGANFGNTRKATGNIRVPLDRMSSKIHRTILVQIDLL